MPRKKVIKIAHPETAQVTAPAVIEEKIQETPIQTPTEEIGADTLVNLIVAYTDKTSLEAKHIVSGVVSKANASKTRDVLEWCIYVKHVEQMHQLIQSVAKGNALVMKVDGKWSAVTE